jgi:hypothetical protein
MAPNAASLPLRRSEVVRCVECDIVADTAAGWKAYLGGGFEGEPVEVVVYCPVCAEREVGTAE